MVARATEGMPAVAARRATDIPHKRRQRLEAIAEMLDDRFRVPGTNLRFGLDGVIGLVPGIGDTVTTAIGSYIVAEAWRAGVPRRHLARMGANLAIDWAVGLVPLVGDQLDFGFKANRRNVRLLLDTTRPAD